MSRRAVAFLLVTALTRAAAGGEESAALFERANRAVERQSFREAAELFERAHRLEPHPAALFNAAAAWDQAAEPARAADAYETALALQGLAAEQAAYARERLSVLKKSLGYLRLPGPIGASVSVAHLKDVALPTTLHLRPGNYSVEFRFESNQSVHRELRVLAGESKTLSVERPPPPAATTPAPTPAPRREPKPTVSSDASAPGSSNRALWGWVGVGAAGALAATSVVLGVQTMNSIDDFEASGRRDLDERDRAVSLRTWTNVAAGGAIIVGAAGIYMLLTTDTPKEREELARQLRSPGGAAFRF
ncbi:MAG: hypothetical protein R3B13_15735 [Polyangiaceae bacterium]